LKIKDLHGNMSPFFVLVLGVFVHYTSFFRKFAPRQKFQSARLVLFVFRNIFLPSLCV